MTRWRRSAEAILGRAGLLMAGCTALAGATQAQGQTTNWSVGLTYNESYRANPFLQNGEGHGSIAAELAITPSIVLSEPLASTSLGMSYDRTQYFGDRDHTDAYTVSIGQSRRLDERTHLDVNVSLNSSILGEAHFAVPTALPNPATPTDPTGTSGAAQPVGGDSASLPGGGATDTTIPLLDQALIGSRQRQSLLAVSSGLSTGVGEFGSLALNLRANRSWSGFSSGDFHSYGEGLSYNQTLSATTTVGVSASLNRTDYDNLAGRHDTLAQGQLTYASQLGPRIRVNAALGADLIKNTGDKDAITLSGNVSGCWAGEFDDLCFSLSRDAYPSVEGGLRTSLLAGMRYSRRLGPRDNLDADVSYSRSGGIAGMASATEYLTTDVSWTEQLSPRLSGGIAASARGVTGQGRSSEPDYVVRAFLSVALERLL